jgi:hypothetical protein
MVGRVLKLLMLLAMMMMPLAMATPAGATEREPVAAAPMPHCPDQPSSSSKAGNSECMLACSAALPATTAGEPQRVTITCEPVVARPSLRLPDLHPDTATPPPKPS